MDRQAITVISLIAVGTLITEIPTDDMHLFDGHSVCEDNVMIR